MGTSYVEFRKHGFWSRDSFLSGWLTTLIGEVRPAVPKAPWLQPLISHWEIQTEIDGGCMALDLDSFLQDDEKRDCILSAGASALMRTPDESKRTGQLFLALLRGEVMTDASSPIDYL
jgi:hypothetical protein